jgi:hypothetical protein
MACCDATQRAESTEFEEPCQCDNDKIERLKADIRAKVEHPSRAAFVRAGGLHLKRVVQGFINTLRRI